MEDLSISRRYRIIFFIYLLVFLGIFGFSMGGLAEGSQSKGELWLLSIGISHYHYSEFRLDYAAQDALAFKQAIREVNYLPSTNVRLLLNLQATKNNIRNGFGWLKKSANIDDTVIIFFSGHGVPTYDQFGNHIINNSDSNFPKGILPYDASPNSQINDVTYPELIRWIYSIEASNIIVVIDACSSGGVMKSIRPSNNSYQIEQTRRTPNVIYLVSCEPNQVSKELKSLKHGIFTHYLIEGLRDNKADLDKGGRISTDELYMYSKKNIVKKTHNQIPMYLINRPSQKVFINGYDKSTSVSRKNHSGSFVYNHPPEPNTQNKYNSRAEDIWDKLYEDLGLDNGKNKSARGQLSIDTSPPNCIVLIDNLMIGATPIAHISSVGEHKLVIAKKGYETIKKTIYLKPNVTVCLTFEMKEE